MQNLRSPAQSTINPIHIYCTLVLEFCGKTRSTMSLKAVPKYRRGETKSAASKTFCTLRTVRQLLHNQTSQVGKHPQDFNGHQQSKNTNSMDEDGCSKCMANTWELSSCNNRTSANCYHVCHTLQFVHSPVLASHLYILHKIYNDHKMNQHLTD